MIRKLILAAGTLVMAFAPLAVHANDRYVQPPPLLVSPDLSAPWVLQLHRAPADAHRRARPQSVQRRTRPQRIRGLTVRVAPDPVLRQPARRAIVRQEPRHVEPRRVQTASTAGAARAGRPGLAPEFLPQVVDYDGPEKAGTVIVNTRERHLYYVLDNGTARRYGVGVGKEGFAWSGTHRITNKKEWPGWTPPAEMIAREKKKGHILPAHMRGGPANPLGARALYIGKTLYRIHGTNAPWTIGRAVSSGCIRMRNQDVKDLYQRVHVGAKVKVI